MPYIILVHFTATGGNDPGVDLVVDTSLFAFINYHVDRIVIMLTDIFQACIVLYEKKEVIFFKKKEQPQPHIPSKAKLPSQKL